nr:hypothetical protein GCM10020093_064310 [Planobispora longispora]
MTLLEREADLGALEAALRRALDRRELTLVVVRGESGIGKTMLLRTFADGVRGRHPEARVAHAEAREHDAGFGVLRVAVKKLREDEMRRGRKAARRAAALMQRVAPALLELVPVAGTPLSKTAQALIDNAGTEAAARDGGPFELTIGDQFIAYIGDRPLVLLLDDLHEADQATVDLLTQITLDLSRADLPVLLVTAFQPSSDDLFDGELPIEKSLCRLGRHIDLVLLDPRPLSVAGLTALAADVFGRSVPLQVAAWAQRRTRGNPFQAEHSLRTMLESGFADTVEKWSPGWVREYLEHVDLTLPGQIEAQLRLRLPRRGTPEHDLLSLAAVLGPEFYRADLAELSSWDGERLDAALAALTARRWITPAPDLGQAAYRFAHETILTCVITALRPQRVYRETHALVARRLDASLAETLDYFETLSAHYREAGLVDDQLRVVGMACKAAYSRPSWQAPILNLVNSVCDELARSERASYNCEALLLKSGLLNQMQQFETGHMTAVRAHEAALALGEPRLVTRALALRIGIESAGNPDFTRLDLARQVVDMWNSLGDREAQAEALYDLAVKCLRLGEWDAGLAALAEAEELGGPQARIYQVCGELLADGGRWAEAIAPLERARALFAEANSAVGVCAATGWHGLALARTGRADDGLEEVRTALATECETLRSREGAAKWLLFVGEYYLDADEPAKAGAPLWLAHELFGELAHVATARTGAAIDRLRAALGVEAYGALRAGFDPRTNSWSCYGFLWQLGPFTKFPGNPVLSPSGDGWQSIAVLNPAAIADGDRATLFYRAVGPGRTADVSSIGRADSDDGIAFTPAASPVLAPAEPYEQPGGCEDPRLVRVDDQWVLTYTAYDGRIARLAAATSPDLATWRRSGPMLDEGAWDEYFRRSEFPETPEGWSKSGAILPWKIDGRWWMYFGDTHIWAAWSTDLRRWQVIRRPVLSPRPGSFDSRLVEPGPPPVAHPDGILLIYNSADRDLRYRVGQALFAADDPTRLLRRSASPTLEPTVREEFEGMS